MSGPKGFLGSKARLARYEEKRNDPTVPDALSGLSPYLHFGHLSPQRAAVEAARNKAVHKASVEGFLEELIVRRELAGGAAGQASSRALPGGAGRSRAGGFCRQQCGCCCRAAPPSAMLSSVALATTTTTTNSTSLSDHATVPPTSMRRQLLLLCAQL